MLQGFLLSLTLSIFAYPALFAQCRNFPVSLQERSRESTQIVKAIWQSQHSYYNAGKTKIYTLYIMDGKAILKGESLSRIGLIAEGGRIGNKMMKATPAIELADHNGQGGYSFS